jgi:hypothetical protein
MIQKDEQDEAVPERWHDYDEARRWLELGARAQEGEREFRSEGKW